jgi:predicted NUDIX family NTP pyrophosphohydrolase
MISEFIQALERSAGRLLCRETRGHLEVLLVHPGGPFWAKKDKGSWSIPKGEFEENEDPLSAALREFEEETGLAQSPGDSGVRWLSRLSEHSRPGLHIVLRCMAT